MAKTPEGWAKDKIKAFLKTIPGCWFFMPIGGPYSRHGIPDIICIIQGRFIGIEVKAKGKFNNTTELQDITMEDIRKAGGLAFVADSVEVVKVQLAMAGLHYVP